MVEDSESHARHTLDSLSSSWTENCGKDVFEREKSVGAGYSERSVLSSTQTKLALERKRLQG